MKKKMPHSLNNSKSNQKIIDRDNLDSHIHDLSLIWLGTGNKKWLVLWM